MTITGGKKEKEGDNHDKSECFVGEKFRSVGLDFSVLEKATKSVIFFVFLLVVVVLVLCCYCYCSFTFFFLRLRLLIIIIVIIIIVVV